MVLYPVAMVTGFMTGDTLMMLGVIPPSVLDYASSRWWCYTSFISVLSFTYIGVSFCFLFAYSHTGAIWCGYMCHENEDIISVTNLITIIWQFI